jgi:hypothetical protein
VPSDQASGAKARRLLLVGLAGLAMSLLFCLGGTALFQLLLSASGMPTAYLDLLLLALMFSGPCALAAWGALVHITLVEPSYLRHPVGRGALHGVASVFLSSVLLMVLGAGFLAPGATAVFWSLGLLVTGAVVGAVLAQAYRGFSPARGSPRT